MNESFQSAKKKKMYFINYNDYLWKQQMLPKWTKQNEMQLGLFCLTYTFLCVTRAMRFVMSFATERASYYTLGNNGAPFEAHLHWSWKPPLNFFTSVRLADCRPACISAAPTERLYFFKWNFMYSPSTKICPEFPRLVEIGHNFAWGTFLYCWQHSESIVTL